jgi:AraC-like DNA-binding protein
MDLLSEVLRTVRLKGALFFNGEFSAPWCLSSSPTKALEQLAPDAEHLILYHFLTEGRAYARLPDGKPVQLTAGDIVIIPWGQTHLLGNGASVKPVDSFDTFAKNLTAGLKVARFGGGGEVTKFVCGFLKCEANFGAVFLNGLPSILKVHVVNEPSGQWLEQSIKSSVDLEDGSIAGSDAVVAKLAETLFVEALRRYVNELPSGEIGWLAGARDPNIGQALALLHQDPAQAWTIADLARRVGVSRTRLAERFRYYLGESPIAYLGKWRLRLGAEMLQTTADTVAEVAAAVGYGSEASFNRAFKREFACPPAQFRRRQSRPTDE